MLCCAYSNPSHSSLINCIIFFFFFFFFFSATVQLQANAVKNALRDFGYNDPLTFPSTLDNINILCDHINENYKLNLTVANVESGLNSVQGCIKGKY